MFHGKIGDLVILPKNDKLQQPALAYSWFSSCQRLRAHS